MKIFGFHKELSYLRLFASLLIIMCVPACAYMAFGLNWPMLVVIPLGILFVTVCRTQGKQYNPCLLGAGLCNVIFTVLVALFLL